MNLSEQTDIMDLLGADLPQPGGGPGAFEWCRSPFPPSTIATTTTTTAAITTTSAPMKFWGAKFATYQPMRICLWPKQGFIHQD